MDGWLQGMDNDHCLPPVPSTLCGSLEKSRLSPLDPSDQHSVSMHNTQQMSLAMEVSETPVLTQVASSTHVGRDTQVYEGKPH